MARRHQTKEEFTRSQVNANKRSGLSRSFPVSHKRGGYQTLESFFRRNRKLRRIPFFTE